MAEAQEGGGVRKFKREYGAELRAQIEVDRFFFAIFDSGCLYLTRDNAGKKISKSACSRRWFNSGQSRRPPRPRSADMRPRSAGRAAGDSAAARADGGARRSGWDAPQGQLPDRVQELLLGLHSRLAALEAASSGERSEVLQVRDEKKPFIPSLFSLACTNSVPSRRPSGSSRAESPRRALAQVRERLQAVEMEQAAARAEQRTLATSEAVLQLERDLLTPLGGGCWRPRAGGPSPKAVHAATPTAWRWRGSALSGSCGWWSVCRPVARCA